MAYVQDKSGSDLVGMLVALEYLISRRDSSGYVQDESGSSEAVLLVGIEYLILLAS